MKIYLYDRKTLEYIKSQEADADPEETKLQGRFVPLLPANSTLIEPPKFGENEIPVFAGSSWIIYPDFRGKFYKIDENLYPEEITSIGIPEGAILVSKEIGEEILKNPQMYRIDGKSIVKKSEAERKEEIVNTRKKEFETNFFQTSLGWIRRKVTMKDGTQKDFLSDLLLHIKAGIEMGQDVYIITYSKPDFTLEETQEYIESLQERKLATMEFVQECLMQTVQDFE